MGGLCQRNVLGCKFSENFVNSGDWDTVYVDKVVNCSLCHSQKQSDLCDGQELMFEYFLFR